jgi:arylsulfatase A-like enzyme/Flp pilus assembly protein TadD
VFAALMAKKRSFFLSAGPLLILFLSSLPPSASAGPNENGSGWNVLLITIDTLRADRLSCYSQEFVQTPNMDSLAKKGVIFTRAFANNPTTLPSHTNILLGLSPLCHGVRENTNFVVQEKFVTLAEHLKSFGYATGAFIGGYPLHSRFGLAQGFDIYDENYEAKDYMKLSAGERRAEAVIDPALDWVKKQESPWFLWIHCFDPHDPYEPPQLFGARYPDSLYDGEVAYVDFQLGKVISFLNEDNLFDRTVIVFTGDHGESLGQHGEKTHGYLAYNTTIWIPFFLAAPGFESGQIEQYVCHMDIFPTVCDLLGIKKPDSLQGLSLLACFNGKTLPRRTIYFESLYPYYSRGWAPIKGYIQGKEKFIESPIPELYDLGKDFDEGDNLAAEQNLGRHRKRLEEVIGELSGAESSSARRQTDRESLERLQSLGYISSPQVAHKDTFGPEDDVKSLLPYHNQSVRSWELFLEGRANEAFELVKKVITERKDVDIAYSNLAKMYKEQGKLGDALAVLEMGLENLPLNYGVILTYISYLNMAGRYEDILENMENVWLPQMEHDPEIWNYIGLAYSHKGDFEKAASALEQALTIDDRFAFSYRNMGNVLLTRFQHSKDAGTLEEAIQNYRRAVELEPEYGAAYNSLGVALKEAGFIDEAISNWEKAFDLRPDVGYPLLNLGLAYLEKGNKSKALDYFEQYKKFFYMSLPAEEKAKVDALIEKCRK